MWEGRGEMVLLVCGAARGLGARRRRCSGRGCIKAVAASKKEIGGSVSVPGARDTARGTVTDAPIFIFDDATAAIDAGTEQRIRRALKARAGTHTTIIISHRLVSIMHADEILFLDEGCIVERGTHEQLLALKGRYFELHSLQLRDEHRSPHLTERVKPA